jgi:hypothetical protein
MDNQVIKESTMDTLPPRGTTNGASRSNSVSQLAPKVADAPLSVVDRAEKSIGDASTAVQETAHKIWSQAGEVASDLADTGHSAANFVVRQINDPPVAAMLLGAAAIGYFASLLIHGRR